MIKLGQEAKLLAIVNIKKYNYSSNIKVLMLLEDYYQRCRLFDEDNYELLDINPILDRKQNVVVYRTELYNVMPDMTLKLRYKAI